MKVSIIVPAYNIEKYIGNCLDSIIGQSFKSFELILVDDGSTDGTSKICDSYAKKDKRIVVVHQHNGGLSSARNTGLKLCRGEYISFVDGDDIVRRDYLKTMVNLMENYGCDIVECNYNKINEKLEELTNPSTSEKIVKMTSLEWLTETNLHGFLSVVVWNKLFKKELFDSVVFPLGRVSEDDATTFKLIDRASLIVRTYLSLYLYRCRSGSIMESNYTEKKFDDHYFALFEQFNYFEKNGKKEISFFCLSKLCIFIIKKFRWLKGVNLNKAYEKRAFVKESYCSFRKSKTIPLKFKMYIWGFCHFPFFYR